ncbi:MAG: hypothetical protein DI538_16765 [Azospira oryzae]|nr:MAG: hypothetical protein DI538_16765 [Azospira oryzae]
MKGSGVYTGQSYFLQIDYETEPQPASNGLTNVMAGGLRVKKISESDGFSDNQKTRTFLYNDVDNVTTGRLNGFPVYTYNCIQWIQIYAGNGIDKLPQWEEVKLFVRTMGSNATLGSSRGAYVGYGKVTELKGISGEYGKTEYYYTSVWKSEKEQTSEFTDQNVSGLPFGPPQQEQEYKRGFLVKQIDYKLQGTYKKVREEINEYQSLGTPIQILGLKAFIYEWKDYKPYEEVYRTSLIRRYGNLSYVPMYTIERKFDSDGITYAETRNDFVYDVSHRQLKEAVTTFDSNPSSLWKRKIKSFYPADYTIAGAGNDNTSKGLKIMQDVKHIHNIVIEKQTWELRNGEEKLVDAEINLVKPNGFEIDKTLKLRVKNPLLDYVSSTVNSSGLFVYDNTPINNIPKFETLASFDLTDVTTGNMLQTINTSGMPQSYLWGYNNLYPIAQSINGNYNSSFYTSFELNANGNWNINPSIPLITDDAMTGNNCFNGDLETSNLVPPDNYTISFWAKGTGNVSINGINIPVSSLNWSVYTHYLALTSPQKISINANGIKIDELRAHPRNARMKTFTYLPITGMTSSSDEANIPTKYQYDALNRLSTTTNHNGVIVKRHSYNLKGYTGPPLGASLDPSFTISGGSTTAGAQVFFTATLPTSSGAQYDWDFGDGTIVLSGSRTAIHVFEGGIYQVRLTVRKGSSNNSSQKSVTITIPPAPAPTWSAPSITVNSSSVGPVTTSGSFPNPQVIKRDVNISVTANPATSGGVAPFKNYIWTYEGQSISGGNPIITTTPTTTLSFIEINWEQPPCGSPIPYTYKVTCKVVDANDVVSQAGNIDVNASIQLDPLVASPTSFNFTNSAGSNTVNITNTAGNVTVIPNASWIHITSITQCSSFTFSVDSNFISTQVDTQPRNGTITLSSANGTITIPISQLGYTYSQCGEGCYWNETQHRCECP